jgi:hypothetical protein
MDRTHERDTIRARTAAAGTPFWPFPAGANLVLFSLRAQVTLVRVVYAAMLVMYTWDETLFWDRVPGRCQLSSPELGKVSR